MIDRHFASDYPDSARFEQIGRIIALITRGNSAQVVGLPGVGKSKILELLAYNKSVRLKHLGERQKQFHFVFTNFAEVRGKSLIEVTKFLFLELVDSLEEREMADAYTETKKILKESMSYQDELVLFQGLKKAIDYLVGVSGLSIVFLFDRFETYIPTVTSDFFSNLRILRNRAKDNFSVVFSLNRPLEDVIEPIITADFYEFIAGNIIYVPLEDKVIQTFRINRFEETAGKPIDKKTIETIIKLTGGHGKLLKSCLEALATTNQASISDDSFFISSKPVLGALFEIWYYLTPSEQHYFLDTTVEINTAFLSDIGLVREDTVTIPLFAAFLSVQKEQLLPPTSGKIIFDSKTNAILKNDINISDKLTHSEFRMLRFLLEHPGVVVDREAIISAVWKDAKTTSGVTDQALDQLVFRLRKKIEDDPNNPVYLHTVKGRGVKFTQ